MWERQLGKDLLVVPPVWLYGKDSLDRIYCFPCLVRQLGQDLLVVSPVWFCGKELGRDLLVVSPVWLCGNDRFERIY